MPRRSEVARQVADFAHDEDEALLIKRQYDKAIEGFTLPEERDRWGSTVEWDNEKAVWNIIVIEYEEDADE